MSKRTRNFIVAALAAGILLIVAAVVIGRVTTVQTGMPAVNKLVAEGKLPGAVRSLQATYHFDNPRGLSALHQFSLLVLRQALNQKDPFERCYVATALAGYNDWSGRAAIDKALNSSNFLVQKAAVEGLAAADSPQAIDILTRFYHGSGQDGRLMAVQGLSEVTTPAVLPILLEAAQNKDTNLTVWSVNGLGHLGDRAALPYLHSLLEKATDPMVRIETAHSIILLGEKSPELVAIIEQGLKTNNVQQGAEAALDLGDVHDPSVIPILRQTALSDKVNPRVRMAAAVALTNYGNSDGLPLLKTALVDDSYGRYLPPLLDHLDFKLGRPVLVGALRSSNQVLRLAAIEAIGRDGGDPEIVLLKEASTRTDDPMEIAQVAWSLGHIGRRSSIPVLLTMIQNPQPQVRDTAADSLGHAVEHITAHSAKAH
ncbi:MAG TPA: HEAT repeat domain-containing protein [Candidatus Binataceae bacterium]|nr:HEAT repeat domain-containing protein [Candidatus Binataceae bacterium]